MELIGNLEVQLSIKNFIVLITKICLIDTALLGAVLLSSTHLSAIELNFSRKTRIVKFVVEIVLGEIVQPKQRECVVEARTTGVVESVMWAMNCSVPMQSFVLLSAVKLSCKHKILMKTPYYYRL